MSERNTIIRSLHDVGLAAWFGGSLMGAVGVNGAANDVRDPTERPRVASAGWARWTPVQIAAIAMHGIGGIGLIVVHRKRVLGQSGVGANTAVKAALTGVAGGLSLYAGIEGAKVAKESKDNEVPAEGGAIPSASTPEPVRSSQQRLRIAQWAIPAVTGVLIILAAQQGEQQRATQVAKGVAGKAGSLGSTASKAAKAVQKTPTAVKKGAVKKAASNVVDSARDAVGV